MAGAVAVLASAPAAALAVRRPGTTRASGNLYPPIARLRLGALGVTLTGALLAVTLIGAFLSDELGFFNPAPVLFWVDFWVGLGIVSALVGNVWDAVSPLSAAGRWLERRLAKRGVPARPYPESLGLWPAVALLIVFSWLELVWDEGREPRTIGVVIVAYLVVQLAAMGIFGAEVWLGRGELFTVIARTLSRLAPLELYVTDADWPCRARSCHDRKDRPGCPACWHDAPRRRRGVRLRPYGSGIQREPALGPGGSAFVVGLLATVVYDGLRGTFQYRRLDSFLADLAPGLEAYDDFRETLAMAIVVGGFALLFLAVAAIVSRLEPGGIGDTARRYAPTLIPIAAVYFVAHYFLYLFYLGQLTPGVVLDPLEREWIPDYRPWTGVPGSAVWLLQAGLIVWGHVLAVSQAHRVSLRVHGAPRAALLAQLPLVLLMVAYTFTGLWVLGQALRGQG